MWKAIIPLAVAFIGQVAGQTVYLAGDSTMAPGGGGKGTEGEAVSLPIYQSRQSMIFMENKD